MDKQDLEARLRAHFVGASVECVGEGGKFGVRLVSAEFSGLSPVRRQQSVYKLFRAEFASGALHALSLNLMTPEEQASGG